MFLLFGFFGTTFRERITMAKLTVILALSLLTASSRGGDDAKRFAGEWQTTRGPLTLEAKGDALTGRLVLWKLPVKGEVKNGKLALSYDEGELHFDANLEVDPAARSFSGMAVAKNGNRGIWQGWRFDPAATKGVPADFSGLWLTDLGLMELIRDGARYRGRYALRGVSTIEGEAHGHHLDARIKANRTGPAGFDLDESGTTLFGAGGTDGMAPWYSWSGRKAAKFVRHAPLVAGQMVDGSTEGLLTYTVRAPEGYKPGDARKWPVALILHGSNMNGRAYVNTIASTWPDIARDYILLGINGELPSRIDSENPAFNYTYINFMGKSTYQGFPGTDRESPALVREAMAELRKVYPIKQYFVGGHSQGGYLAYSLVMHSPEMVAGAFPISAEVLIQNEPSVFADDALKASQRAIPLAIIHGKTDPNVAFSSGTYAAGLFLDAGWPAVRLFADDTAGHMFALLPVGPALRWLEALASDDPAVLISFAERRFQEEAPRDAVAALRKAKSLKLDAAAQARHSKISREIDAQVASKAKAFLEAIRGKKDAKWVDDFLVFRDEYEFADSASEAMKAFNALRLEQNEPAQKMMKEARGMFNQSKRPDGYVLVQKVADQYPASASYRLAKSWLAEPH